MNTEDNRIYIREITPDISCQQLFEQHKNCYVGISLHNPKLRGDNLRSILSWTTKHFNNTLVIVGDLLQRHNKMFLENMTMGEAACSAITEGDVFLQQHKDIFGSFEEKKIQIKRWSQLTKTDEFLEYQSGLKKLSEQNAEFCDAIREDADSFIHSRISRGARIGNISLATELSCKYLLEEIAVFAVLVNKGWTVDVYPGPELSALSKITAGKINGVPDIFSKRVNIEIDFK